MRIVTGVALLALVLTACADGRRGYGQYGGHGYGGRESLPPLGALFPSRQGQGQFTARAPQGGQYFRGRANDPFFSSPGQ